ncbi:FecCD family ABC transporter permease [Aeromicrobium chenweiae]|uniref:FecCD family ABC transporter permease n=1 Tax=Aeromicrobium chenweiae TaxID=2079793 RepID=UPI001F191F6F|nr:iron chelate uptake ABC transporter family permease subunit [Aeromicrobium chenweiae]
MTRSGLLLTAAPVVVLLSVAGAVTVGPSDLSPRDVFGVIGDRLGLGSSGLSLLQQGIVWDLRLPRTLLAGICGAGLATCGVILQSLLRNPLADPYVLGISSGASTGAVSIVVLGIGSGTVGLSAGAFLGALAAFALVLLLSYLAGHSSDRLVLAGIAATQLFAALTSFIVFTAADAEQTRGVLFWLLGSLSASTWTDVVVCGTAVLLGLLVCCAFASGLDAFAFGSDAASSLGVDVARVRALLLVVTALMTALIVSASGAIGFVGLVLPHLARMLVGVGHRLLLPSAALIGAIFLIWVDTAARTLLDPQELPVGVATALIGVPGFALILLRNRNRA